MNTIQSSRVQVVSIALCLAAGACVLAGQLTPPPPASELSPVAPKASPPAATVPSAMTAVQTAAAPSAVPTSAIPPSAGKTYYVRPDGSDAEKCTGLAAAAYPGSGTAQPCAWDHPFRALPPGGPARITGGDTLVIAGGSYMIGYGAPGAESDGQFCASDHPWDCYLAPVPSGPGADSPTRILSQGWDSGCQAAPELWGTQRLNIIFNLTDSSNVEVACLEITDHSGCVENHTGGLACQRDNPPYGDWAAYGLYAEDSSHVHLQNLNIHGLAAGGVHAGRLTDWTVENVRIAGNGVVGWEGDLWEGDSANKGTLLFRHWTVEWNGCGETYPAGEPTGCWGQEAGGYGDGVGTGATGGHWIIEDSAFLHNTSDGLDLLYARLPDAAIEIRRTIAEGNAGNQIKTTGPVVIENSVIVGNCGFFDGQPFTFNVDNCRAYGSAVSMDLMRGNQARIVNTTLASEGDCLIGAECDENGNCNGSEKVLLRNNIFQGHTDFLQPDELTCLVYTETIPGEPFDMDYSIIDNVKDNPCPVGPHDICQPPGLVNTGVDSFNAHLLQNSPAINAGTAEGAPKDDFSGQARDATPDIGAYEWR